MAINNNSNTTPAPITDFSDEFLSVVRAGGISKRRLTRNVNRRDLESVCCQLFVKPRRTSLRIGQSKTVAVSLINVTERRIVLREYRSKLVKNTFSLTRPQYEMIRYRRESVFQMLDIVKSGGQEECVHIGDGRALVLSMCDEELSIGLRQLYQDPNTMQIEENTRYKYNFTVEEFKTFLDSHQELIQMAPELGEDYAFCFEMTDDDKATHFTKCRFCNSFKLKM